MQISLANFLTPQDIKVEATDKWHSKVILEPLERGFGHTLGQRAAQNSAVFHARLCSGRS